MQSQEIGKYLGAFVIVGVLVTLNACAVDRLVKERGLIDGIMLDSNGKLTVLELKSGQVIPSCEELEKVANQEGLGKEERKPDMRCKHHFTKDTNPEGITIIRETRIRIIDYVGSDCRTVVDQGTGQQHESCRPPFLK